MGQKVNPNIFRLGISKKWNTEYFEKKNYEFPTQTFKDLEIKTYTERFLETHGMVLHDYKIHHCNSNLDIYISYLTTPKAIFLIKKDNGFNKQIKKGGSKTTTKKKFTKQFYCLSQNRVDYFKKSLTQSNFKKRKSYKIKRYLKPRGWLHTTNFNQLYNNRRNPAFKKTYSAKFLELITKQYKYNRKQKKTIKPSLPHKPHLKSKDLISYHKQLKNNSLVTSLKMLAERHEGLRNPRIKPLRSCKADLKLPQYKNNEEIIKIKGVIKKFVKSLSLFTEKQYNIRTIFHHANKNLHFNLTKKQGQSLKEKAISLQKFKNTPFFKEGINTLFAAIYNKNSSNILAKFISLQIKKIKRQKFFLRFLKRTLSLFVNANFSRVEGVKIIVKGRINGAPRARRKIILIGDVPIHTIESTISYAESVAHNSNGSYGIKVWIAEKTLSI
jgi:hypothetical protein